MDWIKLKEGFYYFLVGFIFMVIITDLFFPFVMIIMKVVFAIFGILFLIGGLVTMIKSLKKKNNEI